MKIPKLLLKKIKGLAIKLPKTLAEHAFLTFWGLLFLSLILGGVLYYKYDAAFKKAEVDVFIKHSKFKENTFRNIINEWEKRERNFKEAEFRDYQNPFQKPVVDETSLSPTSTEPNLAQ